MARTRSAGKHAVSAAMATNYQSDEAPDRGLADSYKAFSKAPAEKWLTNMLSESRDTHRRVIESIKQSSQDL